MISAPSQAGELIKTVNLNFNSETVPEDIHSALRDRRFPAMVAWIKQQSPDILFIEEGWNYRGTPSIVKSLGQALGYSWHYRLTMGLNGLILDSNGVLLKPGFTFEEKSIVKLAHPSPTLGNGSTWIVSLGATSWGVGGRIRTPQGHLVHAYATHLIGKTESDRRDQIESLHEAIVNGIRNSGASPDDSRILIAGDLNADPDTSVMKLMESLGYQDTFKQAHPAV
ncbi:MAG: endonuclease/exonuclease/phosphatase family protein, partial [Proteobacteria bacterium]|nr:endonuclease/exonuclease/phosphatase family protein [Pseudomonadota bacterium]